MDKRPYNDTHLCSGGPEEITDAEWGAQRKIPVVYTPNEYTTVDPNWVRTTPRTDPIEVSPGAVVTVLWSNGAGESVYRVVDNPGSGPHLWVLLSEKEYV
jgi:hypothetical protein